MINELVKLRALLRGWANWKQEVVTAHDYLSPPNLIYRLMTGDVSGGGGFGSSEPRGLTTKQHNPIYHRLDNVINELPEKRRETILCEFLLVGTQSDKAICIGIAVSSYRTHLNLGLKQILNDDYIKSLLEKD